MNIWWIDERGRNSLKGVPAYVATDGTGLRNEIEARNYSAAYGQSVSTWLDDDGNPGDPNNPMLLDDWFILECLHTIPEAKEDFFRVLPVMLPAEQTRLNRLLERFPSALIPYQESQVKLDTLSKKLSGDVRNVGPRGGIGYGQGWVNKI